MAATLVTAATVAGITGLSAVARYMDASVAASVRQGVANKEQIVVAGRKADAVLLKEAGFIGLTTGRALVLSSQGADSVESLVVDTPVVTYATVRGDATVATGEVAVSTALAEKLALAVGQDVRIRIGETTWRSATVSGILVDPAAVDRAFIVLRQQVKPDPGTTWAGPAGDDVVDELSGVGSGETSGSLTDSRVAERVAQANGPFHRVVFGMTLSLAVLGSFLLGVLLLAGRRAVEPDVRGLVAAGMPEPRVARVLQFSAAAPLAVGAVVGAVVGGIAPWLARPLARNIGHVWLAPQWPEPRSVILALGSIGLACFVACLIVTRLRPRAARSLSSPWAVPDGFLRTACVVAAVCVALVIGARLFMTPVTVRWVGLPLAVGAVAVPTAVAGVAILYRLGPVRRAFWKRAGLPVLGVGVVTSAVCAVFAWSAADRWHTVAVNQALPGSVMQPRDSVVASAVPGTATQLLRDRFVELGGQSARWWALPDEQSTQVRVTTASAAACVAKNPELDISMVPPECTRTDSPVPMNGVFLTDKGSARPGAPAVDPALNQSGAVALVTYGPSRAEKPRIQIFDGVVDDPVLGGLLPGMSVEAGSPAAKKLGLTPSSVNLVVFLGAGDLSQRERATFTAEILRLAPTTLLSDDTREPLTQRYRAIRLSMGLLALLILTIFAASMVFLSDYLGSLEHVTAGMRGKLRLRPGVVAFVLSSAAFGSLSGLAYAWFSGVHVAASFGGVWTWGFAAVLLGTLPLMRRTKGHRGS
ncbi:hypothetical protein [Knoellia remsis]|uniref:hypothetical protein n=1 Tax=Knoellia remsis TaxID=407159 RepID=UPI0011B27816|nr:hypothetical protein [Knoellia remsis]